MKLTTDQIDHLFKFCEKHLVYFYEVQVELVDHLANAIELKMSQNNELTFEKALDEVYAGFGVMGFAPIVREKTKQVDKKVRKEYWRLTKMQFGWPQILGVLTMTGLFYTILTWQFMVGIILLLAIILVSFIVTIYYQTVFARFIKKSGKKFIISNYSYTFQTSWMVFYILSQVFVHIDFLSVNPLFVSVMAASFLVSVSATFQLVKKLKEKVTLEFPEAFQSQLAG